MPKKNKSQPAVHIAVCVKPVPDPSRWDKLRLDPATMLLNRGDIPALINPLDLCAIEQALRLKEREGATVSVLTMAPPSAEEQLREALAMGCDEAFLLTDRAFAGGDTLATARVLAAALGRLAPLDLVLCGSHSLDGSTAQVGPQVAEMLAIPDLTHALGLELDAGRLRVECRVEEGSAIYEASLPLLVTFDREANCPRLPSMSGIRRARDQKVTFWSAADLGLRPERVGLPGSPTRMLNIFTPASGRKGEILSGSPEEMATTLLFRLRADKILE